MDELTLLRSTRDDTREPSPEARAEGRAALLNRIAEDRAQPGTRHQRTVPRWLPRATWAIAGTAAAMTGVLLVGTLTFNAQSAEASEVLRTAAAHTARYTDLTVGQGQYLLSHTHARDIGCGPAPAGCEPNTQIVDVYMPADPTAEWVLYRDWGNFPGVLTGEPIETTRANNGYFYGPAAPYTDWSDVPTDGAAAYEWIDAKYIGGSASREEDNFDRITTILRSGLIPSPQRAALLDALSRIPGVTSTEDVANLDGVTGVAIGRNEPLRFGQRREVIIDPDTGLIIGERTTNGASLFGLGPNEVVGLTAIETTVVDTAP